MNADQPNTDHPPESCALTIQAGRLHVRLQDDGEPIPATIVYLRPLSERSGVAFLDEDSHEILSLDSLETLSPACRELALAQLADRYHLPNITHIRSIATISGTHYWKVETDRGPREFAFKEPGANVTQLNDSHIILRDTIGNRYEIRSLSELDPHSQRQINKVL